MLLKVKLEKKLKNKNIIKKGRKDYCLGLPALIFIIINLVKEGVIK